MPYPSDVDRYYFPCAERAKQWLGRTMGQHALIRTTGRGILPIRAFVVLPCTISLPLGASFFTRNTFVLRFIPNRRNAIAADGWTGTQLVEHLFGLETLLLDPSRRADPDSIADIFMEDFREFGKSGCAYDKNSILEALRNEKQPDRRVIIHDFEVVQLAVSVALVTYTSVVLHPPPETRALRSSIWVCHESKWKIMFHQGTNAPSAIRL